MRTNQIVFNLFRVCGVVGTFACVNAFACSPPPPIDQVEARGPDGNYHRIYKQEHFAFRGEVIGVAISKALLARDNKPTQGIRVRVLESMTKMTAPDTEVEIFVRGMAGAGCEDRYGVHYQLPVGTRFMLVSRSLTLGDWELNSLEVTGKTTAQ
jgi:hypothetical protein